jgi:hypothetical protein
MLIMGIFFLSFTSLHTEAASSSAKQETNMGKASDRLFFTLYESGTEAYGQVGGDSGNACGKYQFDRRYSLINLVKYCYQKNPVVFAAFRSYAKLSQTNKYHQNKLKNNKKFYAAWKKIYKKYPAVFKRYQDKFALKEYYTPVETVLKKYGIDLSKYPYVVQGTVFSYSIQHGASAAIAAVRKMTKADLKTSTSFIKKIYALRIKAYPMYKSRYTRERTDALRRLKLLES